MGTKMKGSRKVLLLIESSRAAGRELLRGIASYAHHHGAWSFFWKAAGLEKDSPTTAGLDLDGAILRDIVRLEQVIPPDLPAVIIEHSRGEVEGMANVITDSRAIGIKGAEHLLACGFKRFAFCGYIDCSWSDIRHESFAQRVRQNGHKTDSINLHSDLLGMPWKNERRSLAQWLHTLPKPVGLMACNDDLGNEVIEACKLAGLAVPDDVAVIGADDDEIVCGLSDPPLSSVAINFERAGYNAARALDQLMRGGRRGTSRILAQATHVTPRRSTDILAVEEVALAKALRYIRDHSSAAIPVEQVARASGISRRSLEQRFRSLLGHSILTEIRRVRSDNIARLLVETEWPISKIAETLGFEDVQHIARYFRHATGSSPLAYRKAFGTKPSGN